MMFVVIAHIVGNNVPPAVVAVCFLFLSVPEVMFGNEVPGARVEATSEEAREKEVDKRRWTEDGVDGIVGGQDGKDVEDMPGGEGLGSDKGGSEGVEENLECPVGGDVSMYILDVSEGKRAVNEDVRKKNFAKNIVEKEELKIGGEVGIDTVLAKELVMFDMIFLTNDNMISNRRQDSKD